MTGRSRIATVIISMMLLIGATFHVVWAEDEIQQDALSGSCGDQVVWEISGPEGERILTISGEGDMAYYYAAYEYPWWSYKEEIQEVIVEEGVSSIGSYAFSGYALASIELPASVTRIGSCAFENCRELSRVVINGELESVQSGAFGGCELLRSLGPIGSDCDMQYDFGDVVTSYFSGCGAPIETVDLPAGITEIEDSAFCGLAYLQEIEIPDGVLRIGSEAFSGCGSLEKVTIPQSVTELGYQVFYNCTALKKLVVYGSIESKGWNVFANCDSLKSLGPIGSGCDIECAFSKKFDSTFSGIESIEQVEIPDTVTEIGYSAFSGCSSLKSVSIPDSVTTVGDYAFSGCSSLENMSIPDSVASVGIGVFSYCTSLENVSIPDSVTRYSDNMFSGCTSLETIRISENVTEIGHGAFSGCTNLKGITIPAAVNRIYWYTFEGCTSLE